MPEKVDAWKCAFCSRCYMKKCTAVIHENACKKNPDRHHCATCVHGIMVDYHVVVESQYPEEHGYGVSLPRKTDQRHAIFPGM